MDSPLKVLYMRIEYIITKYTIEKWHDKSVFGRFLSCDHGGLLSNFFGKALQLF